MHKCTVLFGLHTMKKLLQHLPILSIPSGTSIWCCSSLSSSFLNGFCSTYAMCLGSIWVWLHVIFDLQGKSAFKAHITTFIMHFNCCFCTHCSVIIYAWTCNKVFSFLFNFVACRWIICDSIVWFGLILLCFFINLSSFAVIICCLAVYAQQL